jgi:hypothetical protein
VVGGVAAPVRVDAILPVSTCNLRQVRAKEKESCCSRQNSVEEELQGRGSRVMSEGMAAKNNQCGTWSHQQGTKGKSC